MGRAESKEIKTRRVKANISGIVQGVGFRPFVYQLARRFHLTGYITNTSNGVDVDIEGPSNEVDSFFKAIRKETPPLARITALKKCDYPKLGYTDFIIETSRGSDEKSTLISPDVCICDSCLSELRDFNDRRYKYPFINCTNCGPRYTIIEDIPYDRPKTSMKAFPMCPECRAEYRNPLNRRFHAEPNACWKCGPKVELYDAEGRSIVCDDPVRQAAEMLKLGKIVAIKGLGGFHLAVDATNSPAVIELRRRKHREEKPLALMSPNVDRIREYACLSAAEEQALLSSDRPIVLLRKKENAGISSEISPRNRFVGVMLPYTPLHYLLLEDRFAALVMTSGNISGEPIIIDNAGALDGLGGITDYFLMHNRDIHLRCDDSVLRITAGKRHLVRRSRGFVPVPIFLKQDFPGILGCGGELKNTICLTKGRNAFLSQHIGDLENLETLESFKNTIEHLKGILEITPSIIAYDLHPEYLSTKYALSYAKDSENHQPPVLYGIQHHHAHIASCMAEHHLTDPVIGLAMDGTGYGTDGTIWGGEFLITRLDSFLRAGHLEYASLPGGAFAIREPWRMAAGYLYQTFGWDFLSLDIPFTKRHDAKTLSIVAAAIDKGINTYPASSCGRLFDGISALLGLRDKIAYEGQAAIELEMAAKSNRSEAYDYSVIKTDGKWILEVVPFFRQLIADIRKGEEVAKISNRFHNSLADALTTVCLRLREEWNLNQVVLSGGVFQNVTLFKLLDKKLKKNAFKVYSHHAVPANDGGLSLGQAVIAYAKHKSLA